MEKYKEIIASLSNGICMDFVLEKCAVFHTKCGVIFESPCVTENPLLLREDNYKYLGILECDMILLKEVKESVRYDFLSRLRAILKSYVSAKDTITSIGSYAMTVLWYGFGVLHWTQAELQGIDTNMQKVLTNVKFHQKRSDIHRIYLSIRDKGRGKVGVMDTHRQECTKVAHYVEVSIDPPVEIVQEAEG